MCGVGALFIHGIASSGRVWAKVLGSTRHAAPVQITGGSLRSILRGPVLTPDTPGMGDAQVDRESPVSFKYWLEHFRQVAKGQPMHLVGHSLGGAIAIHLAQEPWVASVTLIAPATRAYCEDRRRALQAGDNPGSVVLPGYLKNVVSDPGALSRNEAKMLREDYVKAAPLLSEGVPWPPFPQSEADYLRGKKVLLIYGENDAIVPACYFTRMREESKSASVDFLTRGLPGCGHIPQVERPAEVVDSVREFWISVSRG